MKRPEDACYAFGRDGHRLTIYRASIDAEVIETVSGGPLMLALSVSGPLMVLLYQFHPRGPRGSAPFAWHLWPTESQALPSRVGPDVPGSLTVRLVDSDDFRTRMVRRVDLSEKLTGALNKAIHAQASRTFDPVAYTRAIASVHLDGRTLWAQQERIVASMTTLGV